MNLFDLVNAYKYFVLHVIELGYLMSNVIILAKHTFVSISLPHFVKFLWKLLQSNENENIITIENESESNLNMLLWWEKMKKG